MANRSKASNDQLPSSSTRSRASSKQQNNSIKEITDDRLEEKKQLQNLNDRLANTFKKSRELEKEKAALSEQLLIAREELDIKCKEYKEYYENELAQLHEKLNYECQNSAKKTIDVDRFKLQLEESKKQRNTILNDLKQLEKKNLSLVNELDKLKEKFNALTDENEQMRKLIHNLEQEKNATDKASKKNLAAAEAENLRAISLENELKALKEKINSQKHFYEKELEDLHLKYENERDDLIEEELQNQLEALQRDLMIKTSRQLEENIALTKQELERQHADELNNLKDQLSKTRSNENALNCRLKSLEGQIVKLNSKIHELNQNESKLVSLQAELRGQLEMERNEKINLIKEKDRVIQELEDELNSKDTENQQIVDNNVQLKDEILIYRRLIEEQENNLKTNETNVSSSQRASSPLAGRRVVTATRKRKINVVDRVNETTIVNTSKGPIAIDESADQFIRLVNRSSEPVVLYNWELRRENVDDGYAFKFGKSIIIQPSDSVTVYSVDAENAVHRPPVEIKMKKNWPIGGVTTLSNPNKEEIAKWEWSSSSKRGRFLTDGDDANKSCGIM